MQANSTDISDGLESVELTTEHDLLYACIDRHYLSMNIYFVGVVVA